MGAEPQGKQCVVASALKAAADQLEREAADLRRQAERKTRLYQQERARRDLPKAVKHYMRRLELGDDHTAAIRQTMQAFTVRRETLAAAIFENERAMRAYYRWKRNRRIVALAARYTNIELAEKFGLSAGRISQIIGVAWGRGHASGHREKRFLIPDADLLAHHRSNQRALKRRKQGQSGP